MGTWGRAASSAAVAVICVALLAGGDSWAADPEELGDGRQVFEANCAMCHGNDASGMMGMHPSLRGAVERLSLEGVEVAIRNGRDTNPPMPGFAGRLSDDEIDAVISYLESFPAGPRNFGPDRGDGGMMGGGMMGGSIWPFVAGVLAGLLVALVGVGAVWLARRRSGGSPHGPEAPREGDA